MGLIKRDTRSLDNGSCMGSFSWLRFSADQPHWRLGSKDQDLTLRSLEFGQLEFRVWPQGLGIWSPFSR